MKLVLKLVVGYAAITTLFWAYVGAGRLYADAFDDPECVKGSAADVAMKQFRIATKGWKQEIDALRGKRA